MDHFERPFSQSAYALFPLDQQSYSIKDLDRLSSASNSSGWRNLVQRYSGWWNQPSGQNQNAFCCKNSTKPSICEPDSVHDKVPPQLDLPSGGIDTQTLDRIPDEDSEARKVRLTSCVLGKSLVNDAVAEPLPPMIRRPGHGKQNSLRKKRPDQNVKKVRFIKQHKKWQQQHELDKCVSQLPFFTKGRYKRAAKLNALLKVKELRDIIAYGRYYIENDWKNYFDPRMDPVILSTLLSRDEQKRRKCRSNGPINRIVQLFMGKVLRWKVSNAMLEMCLPSKSTRLALLWLGPNLAKKVLNQLCISNDPTKAYLLTSPCVYQDFFIINRLAVDSFFSDKESFYFILKDYILRPTLTCKANRHTDDLSSGDNAKSNCMQMEANRTVTRHVCVHQNMSLSLKPCNVPSCPNYLLPMCEHIYAFIPETIKIHSFQSMLSFTERFEDPEDLKGCIFITKPAYLCNGRGINFIISKEQFEYFYHMSDAKATSRHGVLLQRYIECPRLFDRCKFTVRFFLLIIVLPRRRVVGFIHYGLAIFCFWPYQQISREEFPTPEVDNKMPNNTVPIEQRTLGRVLDNSFCRLRHIANYRRQEEIARIKQDIRSGTASMLEITDDNVFYIEDILPKSCLNSTSIYIQMLFAAQCIMDYMQPVIQDYPGTFQTVSVDSLIDSRNKLWILGAGTKIFSGLQRVAPRQRMIMSSIIQESLGVTLECFYKSISNKPLYWNYKERCEDYDAIYFSQDFNLFYETDVAQQLNATHSHRLCQASKVKLLRQDKKLLEDRFREVDILRELAKRRKLENFQRKNEIIKRKLEYIAKVKKKLPEES